MKTRVGWILCLLLAGCSGQKKESAGPVDGRPDEKALPAFEIKEEIHNFGTLRAGEIAIFTFEFRNSGNGTLEMTGAESGCSCLTIEPEKKKIMPGDSGYVKVIFDTSGLYGKQLQSFRVYSSLKGIKLDLGVAAEVVNDNIESKQQ
jgi:hypothetical protein